MPQHKVCLVVATHLLSFVGVCISNANTFELELFMRIYVTACAEADSHAIHIEDII